MKKLHFLTLGAFTALFFGCSTDNSSEVSDEIIKDDGPMMEVRTNIPDVMFERALIELNLDDVEDGSVLASRIEDIETLSLEGKGITDLSGIVGFRSLVSLLISNNELTTLDVSGNPDLKFLFATNNLLTSLDVSGLGILEKLGVENNDITQLDISDNTSLQLLSLANNSLEAIDISIIPNSVQLNTFSVENNPLECIKVNDQQLNDIPGQWTKDEADIYALECN